MKDELAFKQSKRLGHTRQHWDIFNQLANWAVSEAGGKEKVFGTKPKVAEYVPTDLGEEAGRAVQQNIQNYPEIAKLLDSILPGYSDMLKTGSESTRSLLRGEIPEDVAGQVRRNSAFRSLMGGYGGSGMAKALTARDFGRTSLDLQERGQNSAQRWAALASGLSAPYMVSAPAAAEASFRNKQLKQGTEQFQYNVDAAPDPGAAGTFNLQTALGMTAASFGLGAATGAMSGGGGGNSQVRQGAQATSYLGGVQPYQAPAADPFAGANASASASYAQPPTQAAAPQGSFGTGNNPWSPPWAGAYGWYG